MAMAVPTCWSSSGSIVFARARRYRPGSLGSDSGRRGVHRLRPRRGRRVLAGGRWRGALGRESTSWHNPPADPPSRYRFGGQGVPMKACAVTVLAIIVSSAAPAAQWLAQRTPAIPRTADGKPNLTAPSPRAPDGKPDLSGLWVKASPKYARNIAAELKPSEILPWARETVGQRREDLGKDGMQVRCLPLGPAYATSGDSTGSEMMRIVQTPSLILMLNPDLTYRQIWMDGRPLEREPNPSWMGYSVGRWDGDTLVVDSYGFHAGTWLDRDGHPHTEQLRLTERYRRPNFGTLDIEVTLSDPGAYARPWTVKVAADYAADTEMLEWVCNEGANRSLAHWVGKASDDLKNEVKVAPAILARYVGTYVEQPPFWRATQL